MRNNVRSRRRRGEEDREERAKEGGREGGSETEGASETERVKITFVRLPSNMLHSAPGWFNPVFPAADPQPGSCIPLSPSVPIPSKKQTNAWQRQHPEPRAAELGLSERLESVQKKVFLEKKLPPHPPTSAMMCLWKQENLHEILVFLLN